MPFDPVPAVAPPAQIRPLSVLYVLSSFPVLSETFVSNEIRAMRALGHKVVPLTIRDHHGACQPEDEALKPGIQRLEELPRVLAMLRALAGPKRLRVALDFIRAQQGLPRRSLLLAAARVALAARRHGCTHVHAHFAHAATATAIAGARLAGVTVSFIGHGFDVYGTPCDLPLKLASADLAIATCADMRDDMMAMAPGARVVVVPCGIDPARFRPRSGPANGRLLAIGRLAPQKGYELLLDALAALPPMARPSIDAVGEGALRPLLEARIEALGLWPWMRLLGARNSGWIAEHAPRYQGFVAPYVICADGDRDTGPMVLKEAMAMGLPVLASALMGMKETVAQVGGLLIPPGDRHALTDGLTWIAGLPEAERAAIGRAGRAHIEAGFSLGSQALQLSDLFAGLRARPHA
jgi:glycosyltransferase involved in cell wall biosynthesis